MRVRSLGWVDPLEEEMATYSSVLAWRIPWTKGPGGLQSVVSQRVGCYWVSKQQLQRLEAAWVYAAPSMSTPLSPDTGATVLGFIRVSPDCPTFVFIPFSRCHFCFLRILYTRTHAIHSLTSVLVCKILWHDVPWTRGPAVETRSNRSQDWPSFCALWLGSISEVWSTCLRQFSVISLCNAGEASQDISLFLQPREMPSGVWGDVCGCRCVQEILGSSLFVFVNVDICCCSVAKWCLTLWNPMDCIACQASPSMGFPRQEYWSG